jgi:uncharacterized protein
MRILAIIPDQTACGSELSKAILLFLAFLLIYWFFIRDKVAVRRDQAGKPNASRTEKMIACAHCGVHVPQSDAVAGEGHYYCCDEHRKLGAS